MGTIRKTIARSIALAMGIVMISTTALFASPMKDVPANHWAYNDIMEMQKRGLLLASSQGEFFPNKYVTYFDFSQILAKATGYEDETVNPDMDPELKASIRANYEKQKSSIEGHAKNFEHWQKDANEEIAYLLGRGYLKQEDLGKFMSRSTSGLESKRGVRKQEASAYLVRTLHKAETAKDEYVSTGFVDEDKIDVPYRSYVAYLKKLGLVKGDQNGEFGPTVPITRATLSKMLIDTLDIAENEIETPEEPVQPEEPSDRALEGKFTKMISKGADGYYLVLEVEPGDTQTFSIEPTASVTDKSGSVVTLPKLKEMIDTRGDSDVIVTARVEVVGVTEHITSVRIINEPTTTPVEPEKPQPEPKPEPKPEKPEPEVPVEPEKPEEERFTGNLTGTVHSVLIGPKSKITVQISGREKKFDISFDTKMHNDVKRREVFIWDLRLNQEIDLKVVDNVVESLNITKEAPPVTVTGRIIKTSVSGDQIEIRVSHDSISQQTNTRRTINVPMATKILDGTNERGRKDLKEDMEVIVIYDEDGKYLPTKIIILSK